MSGLVAEPEVSSLTVRLEITLQPVITSVSRLIGEFLIVLRLGAGWVSAWADDKPTGEGDDLDATILNFAVTLAFPDLLKEGDLGGIIVGMQPKVVYHTLEHLEEEKTGNSH